MILGNSQIENQIVDRLADTWIIRTAARYAVRGKDAIEEEMNKVNSNKKTNETEDPNKIDTTSFLSKFRDELKKEWKKAQEEENRRK